MSFTQKLATKLNVRTVLVLALSTLISLIVLAAQIEQYTKSYVLLGITVVLFVMYLVTCIPQVAEWIKINAVIEDYSPTKGD